MRLPTIRNLQAYLRRLWADRPVLRCAAVLGVAVTVAATMGQYATAPKLWWEAGETETLPLFASFPDRTGELLLYNYDGPVAAREHSFFQPLGSNGRACVTCHQPANAMSLSTDTLRDRWKASDGKDVVFAAIDGSNCPNLPQAQRSSHSLLLQRGLFRIYLPWPAKGSDGKSIQPEFSIEVVRDPTGCNTHPVYGLASAHPTISVYRRPRMVANLKFVVGSDDGFDFAAMAPGQPNAYRGGALTADGRETTLATQAINAVIAHEQGRHAPDPDQIQDILDFERQIFIAQGEDTVGGDLTEVGGPKSLGVWNLARAKLPAAASPAYQSVFLAPADWRASGAGAARQTPRSEFRASVVRGNRIFESRMFGISETANLTEHTSGKTTQGTCATCHKAALVGTDPTRGWMDVGTTVMPTAEDSPDLPLFKITCKASAAAHPYRGRVVYTNDPGRALTTGKCGDIGSVVMQQFRGLSARAPYFSNGSAKDLGAVVDFYDRRFQIHLNPQERQDLINFMSVL